MQTAPIGLFVYNRVEHAKKTVAALQNNKMAAESDLFVFSDGPRAGKPDKAVEEVRRFIYGIDGFRSVTIIEQEVNQGLAASIIAGVTQICKKYGKVIVLEDDLVTSPHFLEFMNHALDRYADQKKVWHISGWNYPIDAKVLPEVFFTRIMNCWGWATWEDRWEHFKKNPEEILHEWGGDKIRRFNLDGANNFWLQVTGNHAGTMNTWAIFWYATIFEHQGLCLNPARTYVQNIGHDGSGAHCRETNVYSSILAKYLVTNYPEPGTENTKAVRLIQRFYRSLEPNMFLRAVAYLRKTILTL